MSLTLRSTRTYVRKLECAGVQPGEGPPSMGAVCGPSHSVGYEGLALVLC